MPVQTASGQDIGRVLGFILDTERGCILQIEVRPAGLVRSLVAHELLIGWNDVIAWTDESITVRDAAIPETSSLAVPSVAPSV